ncbi:unnamed protein product [Chrysoparadoxa australica]
MRLAWVLLMGSARSFTTHAPQQPLTMVSRIGKVSLKNTQRKFPLDQDKLQKHLQAAKKALGGDHWDVGLWLTTDASVRANNSSYRGKNKSTDILSFPFHDLRECPGELPEVDHEEEMDLGDMIVSVAYVQRAIERDRREAESGLNHMLRLMSPLLLIVLIISGELTIFIPLNLSPSQSYMLSGVALRYGLEEGERGVSGAMANVYDLQERIELLTVHGLCHLVGYDHETDEDYELMVEKEEEVMKKAGCRARKD